MIEISCSAGVALCTAPLVIVKQAKCTVALKGNEYIPLLLLLAAVVDRVAIFPLLYTTLIAYFDLVCLLLFHTS